MKPNPPSILANYQHDRKASQSPLPVRILGWLSLLAFAAAIYSTFFLSGEHVIRMCHLSYVGFTILFIAYFIMKVRTRHSRCSQCQQLMDVIDVKWTPDQWRQVQGYEMVDGLNGADGYLYAAERKKETGSLPYCSIWTQLQIWCACHQCRLYFLKAQHSRKEIFSTRNDDEFEQAKNSLLTDPKASEKMELAYKELHDSLRSKK